MTASARGKSHIATTSGRHENDPHRRRRRALFIVTILLAAFLQMSTLLSASECSRRRLPGPARSASSSGSRPADRPISRSVSSPIVSARHSANPWWSRTSPAPARCSRPMRCLSQPPDGYTLLACTYFDPVNTLLYKQAHYKVADLAPVTLISTIRLRHRGPQGLSRQRPSPS